MLLLITSRQLRLRRSMNTSRLSFGMDERTGHCELMLERGDHSCSNQSMQELPESIPRVSGSSDALRCVSFIGHSGWAVVDGALVVRV